MVQYLPVAGLTDYAKNARTHSQQQIEGLKAAILAFGWTNPVLVDEAGGIIAGHGRVRAARELGMERVPTISITGLSDTQKQALVIEDNKMALLAGWDEALLTAELAALGAVGFDLSLTGFDDAELGGFFADPSDSDPANAWRGMPTFDQKDKTAFRSIVVHFKDQAMVDRFAALIEQSISPTARYLWFPVMEIETMADKKYVTGGAAA